MHMALEEIANSGGSFLVAVRIDAAGRVRALKDIPVPRRYADLFSEIPVHRFRLDTSSSEIRAPDPQFPRPAVQLRGLGCLSRSGSDRRRCASLMRSAIMRHLSACSINTATIPVKLARASNFVHSSASRRSISGSAVDDAFMRLNPSNEGRQRILSRSARADIDLRQIAGTDRNSPGRRHPPTTPRSCWALRSIALQSKSRRLPT